MGLKGERDVIPFLPESSHASGDDSKEGIDEDSVLHGFMS